MVLSKTQTVVASLLLVGWFSHFSSEPAAAETGPVSDPDVSCVAIYFYDMPSTLREMRDRNIAATQADVVGHSMGGLLARLYVGVDTVLAVGSHVGASIANDACTCSSHRSPRTARRRGAV